MRRYHGVEIVGPSGDSESELPLGEFYLVHTTHITKGWERYRLSTQPPRKNMSGEGCPDGWCGSTNDVSVHGRGAVKVAKDARGRVRIRPILLSELTDAEETAEDAS